VDHVFWVIPNVLAGRPGPNQIPWNPPQLYAGGIRSILTLNTGVDVDSSSISAAAIAHEHIPFPKGEPPDGNAFIVGCAAVPRAYEWFCAQASYGPVLVHCSHGKDRTGLFMAYALMRHHGLTASGAIAELRRMRPNALSAEGWNEFAHDLLAVLSAAA
jgi:hypothetical protein